MGSETWKKCKIGLFRPEEIRSLQNNKSAATRCSFYILLKDFTDDNIGHSVVDYASGVATLCQDPNLSNQALSATEILWNLCLPFSFLLPPPWWGVWKPRTRFFSSPLAAVLHFCLLRSVKSLAHFYISPHPPPALSFSAPFLLPLIVEGNLSQRSGGTITNYHFSSDHDGSGGSINDSTTITAARGFGIASCLHPPRPGDLQRHEKSTH